MARQEQVEDLDAFVADLARGDESLSVARITEKAGKRFGLPADAGLKTRVRDTVLRVRVRRARRRSILMGSVASLVGAGFLAAALALLFPLGEGTLPARGIRIPIVLAFFGFGLLGMGLKLLFTGRAPDNPLGGE